MRSVWVAVQEDTLSWSGTMLLEPYAWTVYGDADAWLTLYNDKRPPSGGQRRWVAELLVDAAPEPEPVATDNPTDPDPLDGMFYTGRVIEL